MTYKENYTNYIKSIQESFRDEGQEYTLKEIKQIVSKDEYNHHVIKEW